MAYAWRPLAPALNCGGTGGGGLRGGSGGGWSCCSGSCSQVSCTAWRGIVNLGFSLGDLVFSLLTGILLCGVGRAAGAGLGGQTCSGCCCGGGGGARGGVRTPSDSRESLPESLVDLTDLGEDSSVVGLALGSLSTCSGLECLPNLQ